MTDPVTLVIPADARFRGLAPEVGGRYVVAAGGSEADAAVVVEALKSAIDSLTAGTADDAGVALTFQTPAGPDGAIEVALVCEGKSSVVNHPLPAART
ncbi:MAG: hypothetical protein ABIP90_10715 [Vicinamibacterales bacterium]